jgi:hypothetical protein
MNRGNSAMQTNVGYAKMEQSQRIGKSKVKPEKVRHSGKQWKRTDNKRNQD